MKITKEWLEQNNACLAGKEWFLSQAETDLRVVVRGLIKEGKFKWANWTLTRAMTHIQRVQYAGYSAKQSLHYFEKQYPRDKRPRQAILAALKWAKDPSEANRLAAGSAQSAVWSAESAAESAAWSAAWSAESAAWSAESASAAARSAAWSAESAARSAAWSAGSAQSAESAAWKKSLKYGLKLTRDIQ